MNIMRIFKIGCLVLVALAVLAVLPCGSALAAGADDPLAALSLAQKAIDKQDTVLFESVVDINRMLSSAARESTAILAEMQASGDMPDLPPAIGLALAGLGSGNSQAVDTFSSLLAGEARKFVSVGISDGFFSGKVKKDKSNKHKFPLLFKGVSTARKEIKPGKVLENDGKTARVSATLNDAKVGLIPLELGMVKEGGGWKVVQLDNIGDLVKQAVARKKN